MKTFSIKKADITRKWYVIDASESTLGRVATKAASLLIGKSKPTLTHHMDGGDYVIIINAEKVGVTGNKMDKKMYWRHSGFPGGIKGRTMRESLEKDPSSVLHQAVSGMIPRNKLKDGRLERLKIYTGSEHNHSAQKPETLKLTKDNK